MTTVWEQISDEISLVSLPDVYLRLKSVLDDPDSSMADLAEIVGNDPALAARVLRIVNSAYFGLAAEIDTIQRAVNLLGTQEIHDLVLAVSVAQSFSGMADETMDMNRYWRRSVMAAVCARELARLCNVLDADRLFVGGLLSDIGHLFIYQHAPDKAEQAVALAETQQVALFKAERAVLGIDYAQVGGELMRRWHLPQTLWEPTELHVEPDRSKTYALSTSVIHIASVMAVANARGEALDTALETVSPSAWHATGLSAEICVGIIDEVEPMVAGVVETIIPGSIAA